MTDLNQPQPIETAPKDTTVVLTDQGIARALSKGECAHWCLPEGSWSCCAPGGTLDEDSDYGVRRCEPKLWSPLPEWVK